MNNKIAWFNIHLGPLFQQGLTVIRAWIRYHMLSKMWDEVIYPFPNINCFTVEVWEEIKDVVPHFMMDGITCPAGVEVNPYW